MAEKGLENVPTLIKFTKNDFYSYANPNDTVKFENIEEIKNDRKNLEEKEKSKKSKSIYSKHNSKKNHHENITNI